MSQPSTHKSNRTSRKLRKLPYWLLITIILSFGIGTAGGMTILAQIKSDMTFSVSQPLLIESIAWHEAGALLPDVPATISRPAVTTPNRQSTAIGDDGTGFSAAAEIATGDQIALMLYIGNRASQPVFAQLDLEFPRALSVETYAPKSSSITKVTRISPTTWIIRILSGDTGSDVNYLNIVIAASDTSPGYSTIHGDLTALSHDKISFG